MRSINVSIHSKTKGGFQISYQHPYTQKRIRKQFKTKKEAERHKEELIIANNKGLLKSDNIKLGHLVEMHLKEFPKSGLLERQNNFRAFYNAFAHYDIQGVSKNELKKWFEKRQKDMDYSEKTLSRVKSQLNFLFRWCVDEGYIDSNPLTPIRFKYASSPKRPRVILTEDELKEILIKAKEFNPNILYPFLYAIAQTGARRSEMMNLGWEDVDFNTGFIALRETKNGETRLIKMSPNLEQLLKDKFIQRKSPFVFPNEFGERLNRMKVQRMVIAFKRHFPSPKDWNYHALRHSFAYNFLKKGGEMYKLKAILGHKTIAMTVDLYGELKAEDVENPSPYSF